jgi:hypothetical protein
MDGCLLSQDGAVVLPRHLQAAPDPLRTASAPSRDGLVGAVACLFPWYGLAARCAHAGLPGVLGQALSMQALHGGQAKNATRAAQPMAVWRRGGLVPQASVYPAAMRATRDLLRRRLSLPRQRAALRGHVQQTPSP